MTHNTTISSYKIGDVQFIRHQKIIEGRLHNMFICTIGFHWVPAPVSLPVVKSDVWWWIWDSLSGKPQPKFLEVDPPHNRSFCCIRHYGTGIRCAGGRLAASSTQEKCSCMVHPQGFFSFFSGTTFLFALLVKSRRRRLFPSFFHFFPFIFRMSMTPYSNLLKGVFL